MNKWSIKCVKNYCYKVKILKLKDMADKLEE
jgi:hypothetical protein